MPTPATSASHRRARSAIWGALLLGLAMLAVQLGTAVARTAPPLAERTQHIKRSSVLPPLTTTSVQTQVLVAQADALSGVSGSVGTYGGAADCVVQLSLESATEGVVAFRSAPCREFPDGSVTELLTFPAQPRSSGQQYTLSARLSAGTWSQSVSLWAGPPVPGQPSAQVDGQDTGLTAAVFTTYGKRQNVLQRLPTILDRIGMIGPWWAQPAFVVLWLVLLVGLVVSVVLSPGRALPLLLALALVRGLLWSVLIPPLEGPDETAHVSYAQFLAEDRAIPRRGEDRAGLFGYSDQLVLLSRAMYEDSAAPTDRPEYREQSFADLRRELGQTSPHAGGNEPAAGYSPTYYAAPALGYLLTPGTLLEKIYGMRLASVLLGIAATWFVFLALRQMLPDHPTAAALVTAAAVLQPMVSQQFAIVTNDALLITAGAAGLSLGVRLALRPPSWRYMLAGGAVVGLGLLAKPLGAALAAPIAVGWLAGALRFRLPFRRSIVQAGAAAIGLAGSYGLWLVVAAIGHYPSTAQGLAPSAGSGRSLGEFFRLQVTGSPSPLRTQLAMQLWGGFSSVDTRLPVRVVDLIWYGLVALTALLAIWCVLAVVDLARHRRRPGATASATRVTDAFCVLVSGALVVGTLAVMWGAGFLYYRATGRNDLLQGRYALLAVPALLALPVLLLRRFTPRLPPWLPAGLLLLAMWSIQAMGITLLAQRFYA